MEKERWETASVTEWVEEVVVDWVGVVAVVARQRNEVNKTWKNGMELTKGAAGVGVGAIGGRGICSQRKAKMR